MDIGLPKKVLEEVSESLLDFLATTFSLYVKTQNFHYNVTGMEFILSIFSLKSITKNWRKGR